MNKKLNYEDVTCVIDSREQTPLALNPLKFIRKKLDVADYSVEFLEDKIAIERKSLDDLCACVGRERQRFERMVDRLRQYKYRAIVVTADWDHIDLKFYRGSLSPSQIHGALMSWALNCDVSIIFAGDHNRAGVLVARLLWVAANKCHREKLLTSA